MPSPRTVSVIGKEISMFEYAVGNFIDAIEKNGLPQAFGVFHTFDTNTGQITAACAYGQALINLKLGNARMVGGIPVTGFDWQQFSDRIFSLNDGHMLPFKEIAEILREEYAEHLHILIEGSEYHYAVKEPVNA